MRLLDRGLKEPLFDAVESGSPSLTTSPFLVARTGPATTPVSDSKRSKSDLNRLYFTGTAGNGTIEPAGVTGEVLKAGIRAPDAIQWSYVWNGKPSLS